MTCYLPFMPNPSPTPSPSRGRDPVQLSPRRAATLLMRGGLLRCPNCGHGHLFRHWVKMRLACPGCQLILDRGEKDYFLGSYTVNFVVAEILIVLGGGLGIVLTWPDVPWNLITWALILLMILAPVLFYPFAKTLWLAIDLTFRPLTLEDLAGHGENGEPPGAEPRVL